MFLTYLVNLSFLDPSKFTSATILNFLDILIHLLDELEEPKSLKILRSLQIGLATCVTSTTTKVLRLMSTFLAKVISMFPVETYMNYDDLRFLYQTVDRTIRNGLEVFDKDNETPTATFFGTFLILKTAFANNSKYFEKFVEKFTKFVVLLKNEHINQSTTPAASTPNIELTKEMLLQSLQILKNHIKVMNSTIRKSFLSSILVELIEKSNDPKIIKTIIQVLDNWFKMKNPEHEPNVREKIVLLQKLTHNLESRFSGETALNVLFLELIHFIYSDSVLSTIELTIKLDQAFLAGLRCSDPEIRKKFYAFFDESVDRNLHDRLLYILSSKAWESIGHHYWIKQCIELLMLTANPNQLIANAQSPYLLPSIASGINSANPVEIQSFYEHAEKTPSAKFEEEEDESEELIEAENAMKDLNCELIEADRDKILKKMIKAQTRFLQSNREVTTGKFLSAAVQLCHMDTKLAENVWTVTFPLLWATMSEYQIINVQKEIIPFLSHAGTKVNTKENHSSAINTFTHALTLCNPPVFIPPSLMKSLGKSHNLLHRMALIAEDMVEEFSETLTSREKEFDSDEDETATLNEVVESLSNMYSSLREEDLWAGLWQKYAKYPETNVAIFYEQMGYFDEAQNAYEHVMLKCKQEISNGLDSADLNTEIQLWEDHWIRCSKELNDWSILISYAQSNKDKYAFLLMDCAWKVSDWNLLKQTLARAEQMSSKQSDFNLSLYNGFVAVLSQKDNTTAVSKHIEMVSFLNPSYFKYNRTDLWKQIFMFFFVHRLRRNACKSGDVYLLLSLTFICQSFRWRNKLWSSKKQVKYTKIYSENKLFHSMT